MNRSNFVDSRISTSASSTCAAETPAEEPEPPFPVKLLRRPNGGAGGRGGRRGGANSQKKPAKTLEVFSAFFDYLICYALIVKERQAAYDAARNRILGENYVVFELPC